MDLSEERGLARLRLRHAILVGSRSTKGHDHVPHTLKGVAGKAGNKDRNRGRVDAVDAVGASVRNGGRWTRDQASVRRKGNACKRRGQQSAIECGLREEGAGVYGRRERKERRRTGESTGMSFVVRNKWRESGLCMNNIGAVREAAIEGGASERVRGEASRLA